MSVTEVRHPLVRHKLGLLRDVSTSTEMFRRLVNELHLYRRMTLAQGGTLPASTREHREILKLIAEGQPAAAGRALHEHVMASRTRMHRASASALDGSSAAVAEPRRRRASK